MRAHMPNWMTSWNFNHLKCSNFIGELWLYTLVVCQLSRLFRTCFFLHAASSLEPNPAHCCRISAACVCVCACVWSSLFICLHTRARTDSFFVITCSVFSCSVNTCRENCMRKCDYYRKPLAHFRSLSMHAIISGFALRMQKQIECIHLNIISAESETLLRILSK